MSKKPITSRKFLNSNASRELPDGVLSQTASDAPTAQGSDTGSVDEAPEGVVEVQAFEIENREETLLSEEVQWRQAYDDSNNVGPVLGLPVQTGFFDDELETVEDGEFVETNLVTYHATLQILANNTEASAELVHDFSDAVEIGLGVNAEESTISGENFSATSFDSEFEDVDIIESVTVDNDSGEAYIEIAQQDEENVDTTFDLDLSFEADDPVEGLDIQNGFADIGLTVFDSAEETIEGDVFLAFESGPTGISAADAVNFDGVEEINANINPDDTPQDGAYGQYVGSQIVVQGTEAGDTVEIYEAERESDGGNYTLGDRVWNEDTSPSNTQHIDTSDLGEGEFFIGFNELDEFETHQFVYLSLYDLNMEVETNLEATAGGTLEVDVSTDERDAIRPSDGGHVQLWVGKAGDDEISDVIHVDREQLLGVTGDAEFEVDPEADLDGDGEYRAIVIHEDSGIVGESVTDVSVTEIADWNELNAVRNDPDGNYLLVNDLDEETPGYDEHVGDSDEGWEPIILFDGIFDGDGHEISDLTIDKPEEIAVGLFGSLNNGHVKNISLVDCDVTGEDFVGGLVGSNGGTISEASVSGDVVGETLVGLLVGENDGTVTESMVQGSVIGSDDTGGLVGENREDATVKDCSATVTVGDRTRVGGLIGRNQGLVEDCYAEGEVSGTGFSAGGLIGNNSGHIISSYAVSEITSDGSRVGGLTGVNSGEVSLSFSEGKVTGGEEVGGLVGENATGSVAESYATGDVTGDLNVGGICGQNSAIIMESYATGAVFGAIRVGGFVGDNQEGTIVESYWDTESSERDAGIGRGEGDVIGLETNEMQGEAAADTMTGLDFEETWVVVTSPDEYPALRWRGFLLANIEPDPISVGEKATMVVEAGNTTQLTIYKLWTDWEVTPDNLDGGTVTNIELPGTPDDGTVELSWEDQAAVTVSLGIEPNQNTTPEPKYIGGEYVLELRRNDGAEAVTETLQIIDE